MLAASKRSICCSCGKLVPTTDIHEVNDEDDFILPLQGSLDYCGHHENAWDFCGLCHTALSRGSIPKFSAKNLVNVTMCQHYPPAFEDLTAIEECLIAKSHPVGTILKLRPGGYPSPISYNALRGHIIVIPQNPGPLLQILPSLDLRLDSLIKVFWLGKRPPADRELKPFLQVRKNKVLAALQYLVQHNHLYHDLTINYSMIDTWNDDFIPSEIQDNIICLGKSDHHEREGYTVSLQAGNSENDLQATQDQVFDSDSEALITGSVYTDINGERQDPNARIIDTLLAVVADNRHQTDERALPTGDTIDTQRHKRRDIPTISYAVHGQFALINNWEHSYYFTSAFPTLFPKGIGGHQDQRSVPVSLMAFAEWTLNHHSRRHVVLIDFNDPFIDFYRFARHKTFMYLIYDVIQLRCSSLGNTILVKRQNWRSVKDDIVSLTVDQLEDAAKTITNGGTIDNPVIQRLQQTILTIGMQVPGSFSQKLMMRSKIKGLIARDGMPAFWITINPSDLRNPLVLLLAGIEFAGDAFPTVNAAIRHATATSNPVAIAQFFHHSCKGIFDGLLGTNTGRIGILGQVANHFGVVETNGRGMLHLHALVWLTGNLAFSTLRDQLLHDKPFASRMIRYLEIVIVQSIDLGVDGCTAIEPEIMHPFSKSAETDNEFYARLRTDSNAVAYKKQIHSSNHNATCFKYHQRSQGKDACRFGMPRDLLSTSMVDELGVIHLARNHCWVNPWNTAIASCIRSNHDISWIPTVVKALCLIYYITNYATKDDVSPYQMLVKAALLKRSIEKAKATLTPDATDVRIRKKDMDQFALRCFNTLSHDREVSGVQIASSLLQLPTYYTRNYNFVQVNLWWLRRYMQAAIQSNEPAADSSSDPMSEEQCAYPPGDKTPVSRFDNYKWRGLHLACLSFFEYCMLVQTKTMRNAIAADLQFDPKHSTHVQRLARSKSQIMAVTFNDNLLTYHPKST
jgi:hypothetical protein